VNLQEDRLYTMHYVVLMTSRGGMEFRDGPVAESWHDRCRPKLRELITFLQEDIYPWVFHKLALFDGLLWPQLSVAKVLLLLVPSAVCDSCEAKPKKRQKNLLMQLRKVETLLSQCSGAAISSKEVTDEVVCFPSMQVFCKAAASCFPA
jgi:hypothetical protein